MNTNALDKLLKEVLQFNDFGGPSSKNWAGFFEIRKRVTKKDIDKTISFLISNIEEDLNSFIIAVSYYMDNFNDHSSDNYKIYKDVIISQNELIKLGVIKQINKEKYFNDIEFDRQHFGLSTTFRFYLPDRVLIKQLSLIGLCESNVEFNDGQCFFISVKNNIIIYPHGDNSGYGFYVINKDEKSQAFEILDKASKIDFLEIHIAKQFQ